MATGDDLLRKGTAIVLRESGGDVAFSPKNMATGNGWRSAVFSIGDVPRPAFWILDAENQCQATPTLYNLIRYYLGPWNNETGPADPDGNIGSSDGSFGSTEALLVNLNHVMNTVVQAAAADTIFRKSSGPLFLAQKNWSLVVWNASGASFTNDANEHIARLTPYYFQDQA